MARVFRTPVRRTLGKGGGGIFGGGGGLVGGGGGGGAQSAQRPVLPSAEQFGTATGFIGDLSDPLQQSVDIQRDLLSSLLGLPSGGGDISQPGFREDALPGGEALRGVFAQAGQGAQRSINEAFGTLSKNVTGDLVSRGLGGSSLQLTGQLGVERERQSALGGLLDSLLGQQIQTQVGVSGNLSNLFQGAAGQQFNLLNALLGSNQQSTGEVSTGVTKAPSAFLG